MLYLRYTSVLRLVGRGVRLVEVGSNCIVWLVGQKTQYLLGSVIGVLCIQWIVLFPFDTYRTRLVFHSVSVCLRTVVLGCWFVSPSFFCNHTIWWEKNMVVLEPYIVRCFTSNIGDILIGNYTHEEMEAILWSFKEIVDYQDILDSPSFYVLRRDPTTKCIRHWVR